MHDRSTELSPLRQSHLTCRCPNWSALDQISRPLDQFIDLLARSSIVFVIGEATLLLENLLLYLGFTGLLRLGYASTLHSFTSDQYGREPVMIMINSRVFAGLGTALVFFDLEVARAGPWRPEASSLSSLASFLAFRSWPSTAS